MSDVIKVDVWSDIACPWCYIGKRKFEAGAEGFDVEVEYHRFELSPDTPVDFDGSAADFLAKHKGMPIEQVRPMLAQVRRSPPRSGWTTTTTRSSTRRPSRRTSCCTSPRRRASRSR